MKKIIPKIPQNKIDKYYIYWIQLDRPKYAKTDT